MALDPKVWGPYYWFFLHTMALSYPIAPNEVMRKKYYEFIQNLPLFLPIPEIGNEFSKIIDRYPVTPYLDSRQSFVKWMHFIHNKINISLDLPEKTMEETMTEYYELYKPKAVKDAEQRKRREKYIFFGLIVLILLSAAYLYNK